MIGRLSIQFILRSTVGLPLEQGAVWEKHHDSPWQVIIPWLALASWGLLLLLSRVSRVQLCATPWTTAHQAPLSLGLSRQEHWSGLPFPSPVHESEKWKWSCSLVSDSSRPHGLQPTRLLHPWDSPGKSTEVGCHCLFQLGARKSKY